LIYIFDACALIALFKREQGAVKVKALLDEAVEGRSVIYMHAVNLIEVHYGFYRALGREKAAIILEQIKTMPIHFIDEIDETIFSETSRLKAQYSIPLGDSIGMATAIKMKGTFVTADHSDFGSMEGIETIPFIWFR
jgi:PIN domain nuclease of toxin-antitoxin system